VLGIWGLAIDRGTGEWRKVEIDIVRITGLGIFLNNIFGLQYLIFLELGFTRDGAQKLANKIASNQFSYSFTTSNL
jgi:hypothetical protein